MINKFPGELTIYKSSDTTDDMNIEFTPEFLNSCDLPGLAPHCLQLKKGMMVMVMSSLSRDFKSLNLLQRQHVEFTIMTIR